MKTVGTITEILDLFYKRIDNISIHTKYTAENGKYGYELKDGILYRRGKQIGVCNKYLPFVVRLHDIEDYLYRPLVKLKNQKIRGKINVDIYNICRENTNIIYNDIYSILSALWYGINQNLNVTRHIFKQDITNQRFADVRTNQIKYNNARKAWRSALKDILSICKAQGIDANNIINKAYTLYNTYVEYKGYKKLYNTFDTTINLKDNILITTYTDLIKYHVAVDDKLGKSITKESIDNLKIKTPDEKTQIRNLSGGNQQKVVFARWLLSSPDILILDEPTRGIDVGAKFEIYNIIIDLAQKGKSIILITSEMSELLGLSDRIVVMCEGKKSGILDKKEANQEKIMELATKYM